MFPSSLSILLDSHSIDLTETHENRRIGDLEKKISQDSLADVHLVHPNFKPFLLLKNGQVFVSSAHHIIMIDTQTLHSKQIEALFSF